MKNQIETKIKNPKKEKINSDTSNKKNKTVGSSKKKAIKSDKIKISSEKKDKKAKEKEISKLMYKGRRLLRFKDSIYYGDMSEDYIVVLEIKSKKKVKNKEIADKVSIRLLDTDPEVDIFQRIVKKSEKQGLYKALDIANAWLNKALAD
ncbi:MAG: hypothetical protein LBF33_00695 [Oscillospiraceae bacterium]|jgi:hypothetical protein|nr:hypothetical protein [Oscillospiraceae bacterium]